MFKYVGRSVAGIKKLKQQNAIIELSSVVTVQSVDEYTLLVKVSPQRAHILHLNLNSDTYFIALFFY